MLVDGNMLPPGLALPGEAIVGGDGLSVSIAAASIVAKVTRDRLMANVGRAFPDYGFERHMGYSTPEPFRGAPRARPLPAPPAELRAGARAAAGCWRSAVAASCAGQAARSTRRGGQFSFALTSPIGLGDQRVGGARP